MLYEKFIRLVEEHADLLTNKWIEEVTNNPATPGYKNLQHNVLVERAYDDYRQLGSILLKEDPTFKNKAEHYIKIGRARAKEGLKASEVVYALILSRVVLWNYIISQGVINSTIDLQLALEFYQKINNFYDKAAYFVTVGHESLTESEGYDIRKKDFIEKTVGSISKWFIKEIK
jgi:hypothetical protein